MEGSYEAPKLSSRATPSWRCWRASMDDLITPLQAYRRYGVFQDTLARWTEEGKLPIAHRTMGGHRRYRASDVQQAVENRRSPGRPRK